MPTKNDKIEKLFIINDLKFGPGGDDSFLPVCSVSCTVHYQLFINNDLLQFSP